MTTGMKGFFLACAATVLAGVVVIIGSFWIWALGISGFAPTSRVAMFGLYVAVTAVVVLVSGVIWEDMKEH